MSKDERRPRCGICNVFADDWDAHEKSEQHQKYLNDPELMARMIAQNKANLLIRKPLNIREIRVIPKDQVDKNNPEDLYNWHVTIRDGLSRRDELGENIQAILLYLVKKYGEDDYRVKHIRTRCKDLSSESLEIIRYMIHTEVDGITHEDMSPHGTWLDSVRGLYDTKEEKSE